MKCIYLIFTEVFLTAGTSIRIINSVVKRDVNLTYFLTTVKH